VEWSDINSVTTMWVSNTSVDQRRFFNFIIYAERTTNLVNNTSESVHVADDLYKIYR
jgi:hypothetical protein